jgi:DNA polymerase
MSETDIDQLVLDLKTHLRDHDGELVYWGPAIVKRNAPKPAAAVATPTAPVLDKAAALEKLRVETIGDCHLCPLGDTRKKLAFGVGNPESDVMFIGEGPGYEEDRQGVPFVGKAGQLLDKILLAINLDRTKVYIANVVKCHPMVDPTDPEKRGNDRPPEPEEMEKCMPFLREQINIIRPKVIVTLGATASRAVLATSEGITRLRGKVVPISFFDDAPPIPVLPTYHPAALLRNPDLKKDVWVDMKKLRDMLAK